MQAESRFSRADLAVVMGVLVLLVFFFIPCCSRYTVQQEGCSGSIWAYSDRIRCADRLQALGRAMGMYQCDFNNLNPIAWDNAKVEGHFGIGLYNSRGGKALPRWANPEFDDWTNQPTVGGCLYMLVRYEDIDPRMFLCPADADAEEMKLEDAQEVAIANGWEVKEFGDLKDFQSMVNLSYSYNDPWASLLSSSTASECAVLADKSPAYDTETGVRRENAGDFPIQNDNGSWDDHWGRNSRHGNSRNHKTVWQNVLLADWSVAMHRTPIVEIVNVSQKYNKTVKVRHEDNIYTYWPEGKSSSLKQKRLGRWDEGHSAHKLDLYLGN